jgi:hypothetical protein
MKKTLTKIFGSSGSFLRAGKAGFLLFAALFCSTALSAQVIIITDPGVPSLPSSTKVQITRATGNLPSPVSLEIKSGSTTEANTFLQNPPTGTTNTFTYTFPQLFTLPGNPAAVRTFRVSFSNPGMTSRYYPVPTTIGASTTIIPGFKTSEMDRGLWYCAGPDTSFGYGVILTRTSSTTYLIECTKFFCHLCDPCTPITPTVSKSGATEQNNKMKLYPNPSNGYAELEYTALGKESITVNVADIAGKSIYQYKTDVTSGVNKLPIDIQTSVSGTYYVNWRSSNGNSGSLQLIKK